MRAIDSYSAILEESPEGAASHDLVDCYLGYLHRIKRPDDRHISVVAAETIGNEGDRSLLCRLTLLKHSALRVFYASAIPGPAVSRTDSAS